MWHYHNGWKAAVDRFATASPEEAGVASVAQAEIVIAAGQEGGRLEFRWWQSVRFGIFAVVVFRAVTAILVVAGLFGNEAVMQVTRHPGAALFTPWLQWDAQWQVAIAHSGYGIVIVGAHHTYSTAAFQPILPGLIAATERLTGLSSAAAGLTIATLAVAAGLVGLHRLVAVDYGLQAAGLTVILLLLFPTALFLGAPYAEPLVLAEVVWAFVAVRRARPLLGGLLVGAAILTKLFAGVFLIALATEAAAVAGPVWRARLRGVALSMLGPLAGIVGLGAFYGIVFHNPLIVLFAEQDWSGRQLALPVVSLWKAFHPPPHFNLNDAAAIADLAAVVLLMAAALFAWMRLRRSYAVALTTLLLAFTSTSTLVSTARWTLDAFPLFIVGGVLAAKRPWLRLVLIGASAPSMVLFLWIYSHGGWAG